MAKETPVAGAWPDPFKVGANRGFEFGLMGLATIWFDMPD
jgi:hypothetical protein